MTNNERSINARKHWLKCYEQLGSVSKAAIRCGVPRSTLYRWINRARDEGVKGLEGRSKRPKTIAKQKIDKKLIDLILSIRKEFQYGPQRISIHLLRMHDIELSAPTIWRVLQKENIPNIKRYHRHSDVKRYNRPVPGDRVQIDVAKIGPKCYQYTAIDDCTRLRAIKLYPNKKAESSVDLLGYLLDVFQFPVQRIQTDWGTEFFNDTFQEELMVHFIKFRPIKPRSPHLNGKVDRSQLTDKAEFYKLIPKSERNTNLADWLWNGKIFTIIEDHMYTGWQNPLRKTLGIGKPHSYSARCNIKILGKRGRDNNPK